MPGLPVRLLPSGRLSSVGQGSDDEIAQRVLVVCRTPPGWLDGRPTFGLQEQTFNPSGVDLAEVDAQLRALGPDVLYRITEDPSLMDDGLDQLGLETGAA
jgi:hypothetical protein